LDYEDRYTLAVLTNVLDIQHIPILEDWINFCNGSINELVVLTSKDRKILEVLKEICFRENITLKWVGYAAAGKDWDEDGYLRSQLDTTHCDYALMVKLDTIPFRSGHKNWFLDSISLMLKKNAFFITGTTQPYRADRSINDRYMTTQRVSNNFLIIRPSDWLSLQEKYTEETKNRGRFAAEARLEIHCKQTDLYGIRILNSNNWRIFHTQLWDERLLIARQKFKEGIDISKYMKGFQDNMSDPWKSYYMHPVPSMAFRIRLNIQRFLRRNKKRLKIILSGIANTSVAKKLI